VICLGSNIQPALNLRRAVKLLQDQTSVRRVSSAWESRAVGATETPNFLNACVELFTELSPAGLVEELIRPTEAALGRRRTEDKNAPRTIDADLILYDDEPMRMEYWQEAFLLVPLAELHPELLHPLTGQRLAAAAEAARAATWMRPRPEALKGL